MAANQKLIGSFWTPPPASFRVNVEFTKIMQIGTLVRYVLSRTKVAKFNYGLITIIIVTKFTVEMLHELYYRVSQSKVYKAILL